MTTGNRYAPAADDPAVRARFLRKVVEVPGSECRWWLGAISGRGHGRFWIGPGRVAIAHRFAYAVVHGVAALDAAPLLGHRCDNPLCQRIDDDHVAVSSASQNRREFLARRGLIESPLADPRGARARAEALRALARSEPDQVQAEIARVRALLPEQLALLDMTRGSVTTG